MILNPSRASKTNTPLPPSSNTPSQCKSQQGTTSLPAPSRARYNASRTSSIHKGISTSTDNAYRNHTHNVKEEDLETVLDMTPGVIEYDGTGRRTYERACKKFGVVPSSNCLHKLGNSKSIDMKHYGLGDKGTMAVAMALMVNRKINTINMQGNNIGPGGMLYLEKMMCSNSNITELSLSDNNLGNFGATAIQSILTDNRTLSRLELAGVSFTDADAPYITKVVQESPNLLYLDLSHNDFGDLSGDLFTEMLAENGALQELNLSWNKFRKTGAKKVARGIKDNAYLKVLNFAWNGIEDGGGIAFGKALKANEVLNTLDLTCTRMGPAGFMAIMETIGLNESLTTLRIGKNSIPEDIATAALQILRSYGTLRLETLDMTDVTFSSQFAAEVESLREMHHNINVVYGYSENYGKNKINTQDILEEGMLVLRDYCKENGVSLVDLFSRFDRDNSMSVTLDDFQEGMRDTDIPLSLYKIELFAQALDKDGDGEIDYSELVLYTKKWQWHTNGDGGVFLAPNLEFIKPIYQRN